MNGLNKHLGADGIRLHVQCWLTHANMQHFFNEAIKFAATFRDDVELLDEAFRHFKQFNEQFNVIAKCSGKFDYVKDGAY